ncbi:alanine--tRNA ligase [Puniceicoccus vermicola]|uniref:Alanine--tRNA ligase n=1 Tax=Puniceicoccus vermicola TaxID=388746 RepID=A0A7X1E4W6_9BACT|nr:alanine--tRNA ligase [Puniceicoccus vermicola]MBC2601027.1 alanine--tRNA ligase [Puniceicoccus vermicola]
MLSSEIRQSFLDHFRSKGHEIVPSASLMPTSPNLLFTNAGMNQFVPYFLEEEKAPFNRAADTQKCIRAGGKHNDLEDVGFDTYHHTFFEMLGNWSFGDYFKEEAIEYAWELLTAVWGFPKERLYATVYQPGPRDPASFDEEASAIWSRIFEKAGLDPKKHVLTGNKKDNFWMMGDTGPCGPCSEVHIDLTPEGDTNGDLVNQDSPWCIEIWNLVFIQFNANPDGSFVDLPARHVDTGMGFERVAGILATTKNFTDFSQPPSNYNSDLFTDLFSHLESQCDARYTYTMPEGDEKLTKEEIKDCVFRVIADHIRTLSFSIADGILPGNEGRNYVLRRILRRAVMFGKRLNLPNGFFANLAPVLIEKMSEAFPELKKQEVVIRKVLESEESAFEKTIDRGLQLFEKQCEDEVISGEEAFTLYDTYGFPLDLTEILARERGIKVDTEGFEREMEKQRAKGRAAQVKETISVKTPSNIDPTHFRGYHADQLQGTEATVTAVLDAPDGAKAILLDESPFYAEMGGQVGDSGTIVFNGTEIPIARTQKGPGGEFLHLVTDPSPELTNLVGKTVEPRVDAYRRRAIQRHHSATHILNWALRKLLGDHVQQAGSLVTENQLRFDFNHYEALTEEQIDEIERLVNEGILLNRPVHWYEVPFREKPEDVVAVFGEKYGSEVRIVDIGGFSKELCGGTHVRNTGEIGLFKIVSESGIAAGVRRIVAVCGKASYRLAEDNFNQLHHMAKRLGCQPQEIEKRLDTLLKQRSDLEKELTRVRQKEAAGQAQAALESAIEIGPGLKAIIAKAEATNPNELRGTAAQTLGKLGEGFVVLGAEMGKKISIVSLASPKAIEVGFPAGEQIRKLAEALGGKGGGKPDMAMGGAANDGQLGAALENYRSALSNASVS